MRAVLLPASLFRLTARLAVVPAAVSALVSVLLVGGASSAGQATGLIAFARADGVYVMRADGSGVRPLRRGGVARAANGLAWSPDGRKLAFATFDGIWVMNADGSDVALLREVKFGWSRPTWSPDGRRIAFAASVNGRGGIWVMNVDGSNPRRLTTGGSNPDWSPDGRRIVFWGGTRGPGIYVLNTNGSNLRKLVPTGGWQDPPEPDWSPDGRRIVYVNPVAWPQTEGGTASNDEIWVMDANGRSRVRLTSNHVPDFGPVWSSDGRKIAFVGAYAGAGSREIYTINPDGTGFTRLTHNHVADTSPAWQPVFRGSE